MRYVIINYYKKPNGQMDEVLAVSKRVKNRDLQSASVILDFKTRSVLKSSLDGMSIPREWDRIHDYYYQHYKNIFDRIEQENESPKTQQDSPS